MHLASYLFLTVFFAFAFAGETRLHRLPKRIYNGDLVSQGNAPYAVFLQSQLSSGSKTGGGVIISPKHILTAAHNVVDGNNKPLAASNVLIGYGSELKSKQLSVSGTKVTIHPNFFANGKRNTTFDIAVVEIQGFSSSVKTSQLKIYSGNLQPGQKLLTVGWGKAEPNAVLLDQLRSALMTVGNEKDCSAYISNYEPGNGPQVCSFAVSEQKTGPNQGDAGSAIVISQNGQLKLAGVTSFLTYFGNINSENTKVAHLDISAAYFIDFIASATGISTNNLSG
ncbi:hypothetical protein GGI25_000595 [Coemansia spiralis]|uniref:Peptidase S1 domain-containing protein n=1 Tax=Coemansia spiralis TaxID=417178 RepID=A0A9W8GCK9_9FUNG|nr:trypsin-like cysteine/serine peptidase domain-containing protein [Coemansia spiralis]KAJ2680622.1 hypothetical protein GGI25_000595 [Coemansia spiralis]